MKTSLILIAAACAVGAALPASAATYRCGGIGSDESAQMKADARNHDMMLTFAANTGAYLANVYVDIRDAKGDQLVAATCDGPIMLVDVGGPGAYSVTARYMGEARQQTLKVAQGGTGARGTFVWPAQ